MFPAGAELREDQGSTVTVNFGTGGVCRSDLPFPGWFVAGFCVSQMTTGDKPQFWVLRGSEKHLLGRKQILGGQVKDGDIFSAGFTGVKTLPAEIW